MSIMEIAPHHAPSVLSGSDLLVEACAVDGGGLVPLTVERISQPVTSAEGTTFFVWLAGSSDAALSTPGRHRVHQDDHCFDLNLTRVGRRGSLVSYVAVVIEAA